MKRLGVLILLSFISISCGKQEKKSSKKDKEETTTTSQETHLRTCHIPNGDICIQYEMRADRMVIEESDCADLKGSFSNGHNCESSYMNAGACKYTADGVVAMIRVRNVTSSQMRTICDRTDISGYSKTYIE